VKGIEAMDKGMAMRVGVMGHVFSFLFFNVILILMLLLLLQIFFVLYFIYLYNFF
jgi:hypothetical protein